MTTCPTCGAANDDAAEHCSACGAVMTGSVASGVGDDAPVVAPMSSSASVTAAPLSRTAYLARSMQTAAIGLIGIDALKVVFGLARGLATPASAQPKLNALERTAVGMAEQANPVVLLTVLLAIALAMVPWFLDESLPWSALRKAKPVLTGAVVLAVISAIVATLNVRANLVVTPSPDAAFKWRLAAYLVEMLGLAVVGVVASATSFGVARPPTPPVPTGPSPLP